MNTYKKYGCVDKETIDNIHKYAPGKCIVMYYSTRLYKSEPYIGLNPPEGYTNVETTLNKSWTEQSGNMTVNHLTATVPTDINYKASDVYEYTDVSPFTGETVTGTVPDVITFNNSTPFRGIATVDTTGSTIDITTTQDIQYVAALILPLDSDGLRPFGNNTYVGDLTVNGKTVYQIFGSEGKKPLMLIDYTMLQLEVLPDGTERVLVGYGWDNTTGEFTGFTYEYSEILRVSGIEEEEEEPKL